MAFAALLSACGDDAVIRLPYEGCALGDTCSLGTTCLRATYAATGTGQANQCNVGSCRRDDDCPSLDGRCVLDASGSSGQCYRRCTHGCRAGTACIPVVGVEPLCLPIGPEGQNVTAYGRCTTLGSTCRDGTVCTASLTPEHTSQYTCVADNCSGDQDCPGYPEVGVLCREQPSTNGLAHRCAHTCRVEGDCTAYGTTCVSGVCE